MGPLTAMEVSTVVGMLVGREALHVKDRKMQTSVASFQLCCEPTMSLKK